MLSCIKELNSGSFVLILYVITVNFVLKSAVTDSRNLFRDYILDVW